MFIKEEAMDMGVPLTDAEVAILLCVVEVYIGLQMCTSVRAISERILLDCLLASAPRHTSRRWIVEKAIAAMHYAMQNDVTQVLYMTDFIALLLDGSDRERYHINEYAILLVFLGTGPASIREVFLGMVDVPCGDA